MSADVIVFKGIKFRRYPESKNWADSVYYTPGIADRQRGARRLHEEIWMDAFGAIPSGHHVHHSDHDPLNNDLSNLRCLPGAEHREHHGADPVSQARLRSPETLARLKDIRPLAAAWHRSPEGRAWHSEHGKRTWEGRAYVELVCEHCTSKFLTRSSRGHERFCSNACKSAWRRASGVDDVERTCVVCGSRFSINRYRKSQTCSRACGAKAAGVARTKTHCSKNHEYTPENTYWPPKGRGRHCKACRSSRNGGTTSTT